MCTASWLAAGDEFHFLFNRDERRTRARGLPPRRGNAGATAFVAPIDAEAGGTWIAVSGCGLLLALLNRTANSPADAEPRPGSVSRGTLIPSLVDAADANAVFARLAATDLHALAPFRLVVRDGQSGAIATATWNRSSLERRQLDPQSGLLCSSSLGDRRVTDARTPIWERLRSDGTPLTLEKLRSFERSHEPAPSAESVCMHRDDAETVSQTEIRIDPRTVTMRYTDGPPCGTDVSLEMSLERSR
ncbi:MAG: NRDE family protein [Thermoanaerobaculia bacterium]